MLEIMKPITRTPNHRETQERPPNTGYTHDNSIDKESLDRLTPLDNRSENDGTPGNRKMTKSNIPVTMYADFIESGTTGDFDVFLTRVSQMPAASQNKMYQEKLLLLNEKLCNVFEEIGNVRKFHQKLGKFFKVLRNKIEESRQLEAEQKLLNSEGIDFGVKEPDFDRMQSRDKSDTNLFP